MASIKDAIPAKKLDDEIRRLESFKDAVYGKWHSGPEIKLTMKFPGSSRMSAYGFYDWDIHDYTFKRLDVIKMVDETINKKTAELKALGYVR